MPPKGPPSDTYIVRGEVVELPAAGKPNSEFRVHHEAIDNFRDRDGKVVGMGAMIMEFPPAEGVDISKFKPGDKVQVEFSVWWGQVPPWLAMKVTPLPADSQLEYRPKRRQQQGTTAENTPPTPH